MSEYIVRESGYPGTIMQEIVQELVRCKECRYWHDDGYCNKWDNAPGHPEVWENDFCSFGERRDDDTD